MTERWEFYNDAVLRGNVVPPYVSALLARLSAAGHEAFVVGGCVRDILMGKVPSDWDVCTSAEPAETKACFSDYQILENGVKHGTVTVLPDGKPVEITTYRIDGTYRDGRHPASVTFTSSLRADLARRDFTINAMAFHPKKGLFDPFGGRGALKRKCIECVGDPEQRCREDALRIMRGLRFASVLGFEISEKTAEAMLRCADGVAAVSAERVQTEFLKLLEGADADRVLETYREILQKAMPMLGAAYAMQDQGVRKVAVQHLPKEAAVRLAEVFPVQTEQCLRQLKCSRQIISEAVAVVRLLAEEPSEDPVRIRNILSEEGARITRLYYAAFGREQVVQAVLDSGACWNLSQLAVGGRDLIEAGFAGREVGNMLRTLLRMVIEEELDNDRTSLLKYIEERR